LRTAGIQTVEIECQPLSKEITTVGFVEFDERKLTRITVRATGKSRIDKLLVNVTGQVVQKGQALAQLYSPDLVTTCRASSTLARRRIWTISASPASD